MVASCERSASENWQLRPIGLGYEDIDCLTSRETRFARVFVCMRAQIVPRGFYFAMSAGGGSTTRSRRTAGSNLFLKPVREGVFVSNCGVAIV